MAQNAPLRWWGTRREVGQPQSITLALKCNLEYAYKGCIISALREFLAKLGSVQTIPSPIYSTAFYGATTACRPSDHHR
jgi:hypothetical protein